MAKENKKRIHVGLIVFLLVLITAGIWYGREWYIKYAPSRETMTEEELFQVSGDKVAIMYNYELQKATALFSDGEVYLPLSWVKPILNDRFYWDDTDNKLIYALPESIVTADENTEGDSGRKLLLISDGKAYISEATVKNYTDVRMDIFTDGDVKRIFVGTGSGSYSQASASADTQLRSKSSVKGKIISKIASGDTLTFIPEHEGTVTADGWQRVATSSGLTGYVQTKKLGEAAVLNYTDTFKAPVYKNISMAKPVILAWHQVTNAASNKYLSDVLADTSGINVVSPTWFSLSDNKGNYDSFADRNYVKTAHDAGIKVWALIDNFSEKVSTGKLLGSTTARENLIRNLMNDADTYGFDGINIDFEQVGQDAADSYIEFIRELSVSCRKKGIVLSLDDPNPASFNAYYDRKEQGIVADYVINMGYDEHTAGDDLGMGSTASISFVSNGINDCLKEVPKEKLINGIPFYTRIWTSSSKGITSEAIGMSDAKSWIKKNNVKMTWDDDLGQYYGELPSSTEKNTKYIWMEEEDSIKLKMDKIKQSGLAGVACWKLGLESSDIWGVVNEINQ